MRVLLSFLIVLVLVSCKSLTEPNFYRMSDSELQDYNSTVSLSDHVNCVQFQVEFDQKQETICGTLEEIQGYIQPATPGAKLNSARLFPLGLPEKSRSTNPSLSPTDQRRPL